MPPKHVLLGLLLDRPAYPYQMAERLQERLGPSWRVKSGPLYQAVKRLALAGLIERVNKDPAVEEDRHVFQITERGIEEFERWFDEAPDTVRLPRRPLLVKINFAGPDRLAKLTSKLDDYERDCTERLDDIVGMREELPDTEDARVRAYHLLLGLNLSADVYALEGEQRWAKQARELLTWLSEQDRTLWPNGSGGDGRTLSASARSQLFTRIARVAGNPAEQAQTALERTLTPNPLAG